jgi:hypothetical protein
MKRMSWVCALGALSFACAGRQAVLTVPAVSMTDSSFDRSSPGVSAGPVESKYCHGDETLVSHDSHIGMIDEAVMKAQAQSQSRYLKDVTISQEGNCMVVEATAMR